MIPATVADSSLSIEGLPLHAPADITMLSSQPTNSDLPLISLKSAKLTNWFKPVPSEEAIKADRLHMDSEHHTRLQWTSGEFKTKKQNITEKYSRLNAQGNIKPENISMTRKMILKLVKEIEKERSSYHSPLLSAYLSQPLHCSTLRRHHVPSDLSMNNNNRHVATLGNHTQRNTKRLH